MANSIPFFADRRDAGQQLAAQLKGLALPDPVIYALPRGGVPVAAEIARALKAPLELVLVRKIGAPGHPEVALAAVVDGENAQTVVNESVAAATGADVAYLEKVRRRELAEIERRRALYLGGRQRISPVGHTAVVVDDGLATGATARVALKALKAEGARKVVLAVPIAPADTLEKMRKEADADTVVCLHSPTRFFGVGAFYGDFHQLSDDETLALLDEARQARPATPIVTAHAVRVGPLELAGDLRVPVGPKGLVVFAHGSGSSRLSPRNRAVAESLNAQGFATLLFDLLTETEARDRARVFDIPLLGRRMTQAIAWTAARPELEHLPLGLFGASTGAAAALVAAAELGERVQAVVSRGGRPDLAGDALGRVTAPTLLLVGSRDTAVIDLNRKALAALRSDKALTLVPGASHVFEEPGTLEEVTKLAGSWFTSKLRAAPAAARAPSESRAVAISPVSLLKAAAEPLPEIDSPDFAAAFDRYGGARVVLLGEASHGTAEFYRARAVITKRLIEKHGFDFVAVEADWPDAAAVDRHVRLRPRIKLPAPPFSRFPTWMWRNTDFDEFIRWLRQHNSHRTMSGRVAFYGLDLYNMRGSMAAVLDYLDRVDPRAAAEARRRYGCLAPWSAEPAAYGRAALDQGFAMCEQPVLDILLDLSRNAAAYAAHDGEKFFDATQNAQLVANAERYYRVMYYGSHESWNLRDQHMFDTLERILAARGPSSKAVVWAHNSHIGDARHTEMGALRSELNIGQLCRQRFKRDAALIGFGTHRGTVLAASDWDAPARIKDVLPSRPDSYESLCHDTGIERFLLDLHAARNDAVCDVLRDPRLERYIGVIYRPETERMSHYAQASLAEQYDGFVWFDETNAVTPLPTATQAGDDETYPFGL